MAYRIEVKDGDGSPRIEFEGALDRAALSEIGAVVRRVRAKRRGATVTLLLAAGTEVDTDCIEPLRALDGVTVRAVSKFLARWLAAR